MKVQVAMSHHHALGISSGSRGVEKLCKVVVVDIGRREVYRFGGKKSFVARGARVGVELDVVPDCGGLFLDGLDYRREVSIVEQDHGFGVLKYECDFRRRDSDVQRKQN